MILFFLWVFSIAVVHGALGEGAAMTWFIATIVARLIVFAAQEGD